MLRTCQGAEHAEREMVNERGQSPQGYKGETKIRQKLETPEHKRNYTMKRAVSQALKQKQIKEVNTRGKVLLDKG